VSFYLKLDAGEAPGGADPWSRVVPGEGGLDTLPAGGAGESALGPPALHEFLERARGLYDWIVLDLPAVLHRSSLLVLPEADRAYLVTTAELPSLHLARKAVSFLAQLGFGRDRVRVLVNRVERRSALATSDVEKMLNAPVHGSFPEDCSALDRAPAGGEPLPSGSALRREIEEFATALAGAAGGEKRSAHMSAPEAPRPEVRA
jgi:pilus assembly protein CpaE